jgi:hypothetical protein
LSYYGPLAHLARFFTAPLTHLVGHVPPENPVTTALLVWLLWFLILRGGIAGWNCLLNRVEH